MLKLLSAVVVSVVLSLTSAVAILSWHTSQELYALQAVEAATVRVEGPFGQCTGVLIAPHQVLTAAHCDQSVLTANGKAAKVVKKDEGADLLLLETALDCPCAEVTFVNPKVGTHAVVLGYPYGVESGFVMVVTRGVIHGYIHAPEFQGFTISTIPVSPGNSGGGMFALKDGHYTLVGIVSRGGANITITASPEQIQIFLKTDWIRQR